MVDLLSSLNKNGSGLNISDLTTSLVEAEMAPKRLSEQRRLDTANVQISGLGQIRAQFGKVQTAVGSIAATPSLKVTTGSAQIGATITDRSKLVEADTSIEVVQVARRHVLEFTGFTAADAAVAPGSLQVEIGVWYDEAQTQFAANPDFAAQTLTVEAGMTLQDLADALSELEGVTASVVDKGDGTFSLGVVSETGAGQGLRFTATEDAGSPGLAAFDTTTTNATRTVQSAADAAIVLDGITLFRPTNTLTDVIEGMTLELKGTTGETTLSVERNRDTAFDNITFLVETLNETMSLLKTMSVRSLDGSDAGDLAGDTAVEAVKRKLQSLITGPITGYGESPAYLAEFGVGTRRDGTMFVDEATFDKAFARDPARMDALFADQLVSDDSAAILRGAPLSAATPGTYAFTRNSVTGAATFAGSDLFTLGPTDGVQDYIALNGNFSGVSFSVPTSSTGMSVTFGRSFGSMLNQLAQSVLGVDGEIGRRETQLYKVSDLSTARLDELDAKAEVLTTRYRLKFVAMEQAITAAKSTSTYLTNLTAAWNKDS